MYVGTGLGIGDLICDLFCVCEDCVGDRTFILKLMLCMCVLGWRPDIYFGNGFRMMGVGQGFEICFGN